MQWGTIWGIVVAMSSFKASTQQLSLPISAVWQMNAISEYKGKEDLFMHQAPLLAAVKKDPNPAVVVPRGARDNLNGANKIL